MVMIRPSARRHALVGPPHLWAKKRRFQFDFLTSHGLRPGHRLLDIGCGALRGGIPLIEYLETGHYAGVEARAAVLAEGREELAKSGLEHNHPLLIHAADPAQIQLEDPFDFAWAFSVLYHMPDEVVDAYLRLISESLAAGGEFYANVQLSEQPREGSWQGFPVLSRRRDFYQRLAASHGLRVSDVGTLESLGHQLGAGDNEMMLRFTRASHDGPFES
jgi:cyclopropane fatty-acyl-phospholipid synthase-like methyltransferase